MIAPPFFMISFLDTPLGDMLERASRVDPTRVFIQVSDGEILEFVKELNLDQLRKGIDSNGVLLSEIGGEYADLTLELHPEKSRFTVTLFDTGEFYESFTVRVSREGYIINSNPIKEDFGLQTNLFDRWGKDVEGLTAHSITLLVTEKLINKYVNYLKTQIF